MTTNNGHKRAFIVFDDRRRFEAYKILHLEIILSDKIFYDGYLSIKAAGNIDVMIIPFDDLCLILKGQSP